MLFQYKGVTDKNETTSGLIRAESKEEATQKIKDETDAILLTSLKETIDIKPLNKVREVVNEQTNLINRSISSISEKNKQVRIERASKNKEKKKMKEASKRNKIYQSSRKKPENQKSKEPSVPLLQTEINADSIKDLFSQAKSIQLPTIGRRKQKEDKDVSLNQGAYEELLNIFQERQQEFGDIGQIQGTGIMDSIQTEVEQKKPKQETEIDWSLLEKDMDETSPLEQRVPIKVKIKPDEILMLTRRLQIMLSAGVSLINGLMILSEDDDEDVQNMLNYIVEDINAGHTFSEAIKKFPKQFDNTYVSLVSIGETSGSLANTLNDVVDIMEQNIRVKKKLKSAAIYPSIIGIVLGTVVVLGSIFFIPMFEEIFEDVGDGGLPALTKFVFTIADYVPLIVGIGAVGIVVFNIIKKRNLYVRRKYIEYKSKLLLKMPVVRNVTNASEMFTFSSTMALMLKNGVRLSNALILAQDATNNVYLKNEIATSSIMMTNGYTLSEALKNQNYFDSVLINIILIGEETGEMSFALNEIARFYAEELERQIENLMSMVQPVSMILIGLIAAPVIVAIYLPILDMSSGGGM